MQTSLDALHGRMASFSTMAACIQGAECRRMANIFAIFAREFVMRDRVRDVLDKKKLLLPDYYDSRIFVTLATAGAIVPVIGMADTHSIYGTCTTFFT